MYERYLCLYQLDNSAMAKHSIESGHPIKFHELEVLAKTSGYMNWLVKESVGIKLHPDNINREKGLQLSKTCNSSTNLLRNFNPCTSSKFQGNTEKIMLSRKQNIWHERCRVKYMEIGWDRWPQSLIFPSCYIVHQQEERRRHQFDRLVQMLVTYGHSQNRPW
jgi:hypothetical protein